MSSEERKAWERQQRQSRIIDKAEAVFFAKGYDQTTIVEIAKASGYNKRSLYLYFKDKEEIFLAVVLRGLTLLEQHLDAVIQDTASDIKALGRAFFAFSMDHPRYLKLIMVYEAGTRAYSPLLNPEPAGQNLSYKEKCQAATDRIARLFTGFLDRAIQTGEIHTDLTPVQLMLILWGQVSGVIQILLMRQENFDQTYAISSVQLFDHFLDMTHRSLLSRRQP